MAAVSKPNLDDVRRSALSPRPKARGPYTFPDHLEELGILWRGAQTCENILTLLGGRKC